MTVEDPDAGALKPSAVPVTPSKSTSAGEFISIFKKAAADREKSHGGSRMTVKVSKFFKEGTQVKSVLSVLMLDDNANGYWCFKAEMFGLLYQTVSELLQLECNQDMSSFKTYFKRSNDSADKIELVCTDKSRLKSLNPKIHGNKVISYHVAACTELDLEAKIEEIISAINCINSDDRCRAHWIPEALNYEQFKFGSGMKTSTLADASFWRILKTKVSVERNVSLDSFMAYVSVTDSISELVNGKTVHPDDWSDDLKTIAFSTGIVPIGF